MTLVNWPQIDYWLTPLIGVPEAERRASLRNARELSLCFVRWLQTDAPRPEADRVSRAAPVPEVLGTDDGLAANAYVRESRRIAAEFTVLETHVGVEARPGADRAEAFPDTVGVGSYRIDLHPSAAGRGYLDIATYPFQIPLGALLPQRLDNLLAAGKCLGVTHVTNGCYRLHPVEWNVGEAAGALAAYCLNHRVSPRAVRSYRPCSLTFNAPCSRWESSCIGPRRSKPRCVRSWGRDEAAASRRHVPRSRIRPARGRYLARRRAGDVDRVPAWSAPHLAAEV